MLGHPGVHGNRRRSASIDRSSRAKLGDMQDHLASRLHLIAQPGPFLAKHENARPRHTKSLDRLGAGHVIRLIPIEGVAVGV